MGSNCLPCCPSPSLWSLSNRIWEERAEEPRASSKLRHQAGVQAAGTNEQGVRRTPPPTDRAPGAAPTVRSRGVESRVPSPGATEQALLRTCVPPAATQDTRGRSSARVPCCSPRSHTCQGEPGLWAPTRSRRAARSAWGIRLAGRPNQQTVKQQRLALGLGAGTGPSLCHRRRASGTPRGSLRWRVCHALGGERPGPTEMPTGHTRVFRAPRAFPFKK